MWSHTNSHAKAPHKGIIHVDRSFCPRAFLTHKCQTLIISRRNHRSLLFLQSLPQTCEQTRIRRWSWTHRTRESFLKESGLWFLFEDPFRPRHTCPSSTFYTVTMVLWESIAPTHSNYSQPIRPSVLEYVLLNPTTWKSLYPFGVMMRRGSVLYVTSCSWNIYCITLYVCKTHT